MSLSGLFVNKTAFMPYICCGDPNEEFTLKLIATLAENGADAIELGIPFSDPIADGKTIQAASTRALTNGMTPEKAIAMISKIRKCEIQIPIIVMTYYNLIYSNGLEKFVKRIKDAGADGLIVPDVPFEESEELYGICKGHEIDLVRFITPNMSDERLEKIANKANGFLYAVSVIGTTGTREQIAPEAIELVKRIKKMTTIPVVAGFGISMPEQATAFANAGADGIIIGSKLVEIYSEDDITKVAQFVRMMKKALDKGG
ncbi:MAG: tryptophan synthase subunit alpha [Candidatus Micrarchaeota archaeon]